MQNETLICIDSEDYCYDWMRPLRALRKTKAFLSPASLEAAENAEKAWVAGFTLPVKDGCLIIETGNG